MKARRINWPLWAGFLLSLIAFLSYFFVFVWFPVTRDFPWANLLLFGIAAALLVVGVRRGFAPDRSRPKRSKIAAAVVSTLSFAIFGFFIFSTFIMATWLPASHGAPQVGQKAPDFALSDTNGKPKPALQQSLRSLPEALAADVVAVCHKKSCERERSLHGFAL